MLPEPHFSFNNIIESDFLDLQIYKCRLLPYTNDFMRFSTRTYRQCRKCDNKQITSNLLIQTLKVSISRLRRISVSACGNASNKYICMSASTHQARMSFLWTHSRGKRKLLYRSSVCFIYTEWYRTESMSSKIYFVCFITNWIGQERERETRHQWNEENRFE